MTLKKEISLYTVFGVLATVISIGTYKLFLFLGSHYIVATTLSSMIAILFAYLTNRHYVFESKSDIISEGVRFISGRLIVFIIETGLLIGAVSWMKLDEFYSKVGVTALVIVLNYLYSKFIVFKKGGPCEKV